MAWPAWFQRKDSNSRNAWGFQFQLSHEHLDAAKMSTMKHSYDLLGEKVFLKLNDISKNLEQAVDRKEDRLEDTAEPRPTPKRDLYALLKDHYRNDDTLDQFWAEVNTIPRYAPTIFEQNASNTDVEAVGWTGSKSLEVKIVSTDMVVRY